MTVDVADGDPVGEIRFGRGRSCLIAIQAAGTFGLTPKIVFLSSSLKVSLVMVKSSG